MPANAGSGRPGSVEVRGLIELTAGYEAMGDRGVRRVLTGVVSQLAKEYAEKVNAEMGQVFDNPTPFTKRAASYDRAKVGQEAQARTYIRPKQEDYLFIQEVGGHIERGETLAKGGSALPLGIVDPTVGDRYGNLGPKGIKRRVGKQNLRGTGKDRAPIGTRRLFVGELGKGDKATWGLWLRTKLTAKQRAKSASGAMAKVGPQGRGPDGRFAKKKRVRVKGQKSPPSWRTKLLVAFHGSADYDRRFRFEERAIAFGAARLPRVAREAVFRQLRYELRKGKGKH